MLFRIVLISVVFLLINLESSQAQCWNLVWEEEFTGNSLDANKWSYQTGNSGWGNNELQYYRDGTNNVNVSGGTLQITAREESYLGADYTSARIRTINKGDWTHGKMEARIKMPIGQGIWPACWMLPTDNVFGGWPHSGELDIMEYLGHQPSTSYGTVHYSINGAHQFVGDEYNLPSGNFHDDFHTFSIEWESGAIRWYIDGVLFHSVTEASLGINPWVFDENFHFILNLAVGGNWPGPPDATTVFPQTLEVDYLRVYQLNEDLQIIGDTYVQPGETNVPYSTPSFAGGTYIWTVPTGATIITGQGTNAIEVNWGSTSGTVLCQVTNACGSTNILHPVEVSPNIFENPDFEENFSNWSYHANGGAADYSITTIDPQEGVNAARVAVTTAGVNPWDIQLQRTGISLEAGVEYTLSFWAKSETAGLTFPVAFIKNGPPWDYYAGSSFTTTLGWTEYSFNFIPTISQEARLNIDLGAITGVFYFDNFLFANTAALPVELGDFRARLHNNKEVQLEWFTHSEVNNAYFEILKSGNGRDFISIGKIEGIGNSTDRMQYQFIDKKPKQGINYYQLRQVDRDGSQTYSKIQSLEFDLKKMEIFPNPVGAELSVKNFEGGVVRIINSEGIVVYEAAYDAIETLIIQVPELAAGTYFLQGDWGTIPFVKCKF